MGKHRLTPEETILTEILSTLKKIEVLMTPAVSSGTPPVTPPLTDAEVIYFSIMAEKKAYYEKHDKEQPSIRINSSEMYILKASEQYREYLIQGPFEISMAAHSWWIGRTRVITTLDDGDRRLPNADD